MAHATWTIQDDHSLEKWLGIAIVGSLILHLIIFLWFRGMILEMGAPAVDPVDPPRFRLEQATIDSKYLREFSEVPKGHTSETSREPVNLDIGDVVSFSGSLAAPTIPVPRIEASPVASLSADAVEIPQAAFSALPLQDEGNIPQQAQALADAVNTAALDGAYELATDSNVIGGQENNIQGVGLPGAEDISALVKPTDLTDLNLNKPDFQPILIRFNSELLFEFNSAELTGSAMETLGRVADFIRQAVDLQVTVEGHTDSIASAEYNQELSEQRAQAVAQWFIDTAAISRDSIQVRGYGETRPLVPHTSETLEKSIRAERERLNRRVDIRIEGKK